MIKRLRVKSISLTMTVLISLLILIFLGNFLFMEFESNKQADTYLTYIINNDGSFYDEKGSKLQNVPISGFSVRLDKNNRIIEIIYTETKYDASLLDQYIENAIQIDKESFSFEGFRIAKSKQNYGTLIVFGDKKVQQNMIGAVANFTIILASISFIILFIVTFYLSKILVKPVKETFEKQKRFIADSSHELKTPLTIISANLDMLNRDIGQNDRVDEVRIQTNRMNELIKSLLVLAQTDKEETMGERVEVNFSKTIENVVLQFEVLAFERKRNLVYEIADDVMIKGDNENLTQLISILLDNAIKYSEENTEIKVVLKKTNKVTLEVSNLCYDITTANIDMLFDRFYRVDSSRSSNSHSYGIGLSIAKNIVRAHKGKISVKLDGNSYVVFKIEL